MKFINMTLLVCLSGFCLLLTACGTDTSAQKGEKHRPMGDDRASGKSSSPVISVKAQGAVTGDVATFIMASTTLEALRSVDVFSKGTGIAMAVNFEEGDRVSTNQVLVKLDEREVRNEFTQAKLAVEQAEIALQQSRVRKDQAASDYQRNKELLAENLVSRQEYDKSELDDKYAQLTMDNAEYDLRVSRERYEAAKIQLENTEILSPIKGVVALRTVEKGQMIKVNDAICTITDMDRILARVYVPEVDIQRISTEQTARIEAESLPDRKFQGKVKLISPVIDADTGTGKVTIEIRDQSGDLKPGMFVNVYLTTSIHQDVVKVLRKAIWHEKEEDWAFVISEDNKVQKRRVSLGYTENEWVEVTDGLRSGEVVVTVGQDSLDDGFTIKIAEYEGKPPPGRPTPAARPAPQPETRHTGGRAQMKELMQNPEARKEIIEMRQKNPEVMKDPEKRKAYINKLIAKYGKK